MVRVYLELEESLDYLVQKAILAGFMRENPRKAWTEAEKKEAAKYYLQALVKADKAPSK